MCEVPLKITNLVHEVIGIPIKLNIILNITVKERDKINIISFP